ncbi:MAG: hypothetical protein ACREDR_30170 [Blastocatellia bacterium]
MSQAQRQAALLHSLAQVLNEREAPEFVYLQAKFSSLVSYGLSASVLGELLPIGGTINVAGVFRSVQRGADRMEQELGEEPAMFADGCQREWDALPPPGPH